jgi:hypothetical protein
VYANVPNTGIATAVIIIRNNMNFSFTENIGSSVNENRDSFLVSSVCFGFGIGTEGTGSDGLGVDKLCGNVSWPITFCCNNYK